MRLDYQELGGSNFNLAKRVIRNMIKNPSFHNYLMGLLLDPEEGLMDNLPVDTLRHGLYMLNGCKSSVFDADTPNMSQAMRGPHRAEFLDAMEAEITELESHHTWEELYRTQVPEGARVLPSTWVFKIKRFPDGSLRKFKARFAVRGDLQQEGVDYFEKYAPVVSWSTVRLVMTIALHLGWKTKQLDFSNAFVQAELKENVYIQIPPGFSDKEGQKHTVLKLKKSLYGLVQAPKTWNDHLTEVLKGLGYNPSMSDPCMFIGHNTVLLAYVDDILMFAPEDKLIDNFVTGLKSSGLEFTLEQDVYSFLGLQVDIEPERITLKQE